MVVIIGGGAIGLSIGWLLCEKGEKKVTLLEEGEVGRDASWASAGLIAAHARPAYAPQKAEAIPRLKIQLESKKLWPDFRKRLESRSGMDIEYRVRGSLEVAMGSDEQTELEKRFQSERNRGSKAQKLSAQEARKMEPNLSEQVSGALYRPEDGQVEPRKLTRALREAFVVAGGDLREHCPVRGIQIQEKNSKEKKISGVATDSGVTFQDDQVVLAAGAWSSKIPGLSLEPELIHPVKGQMVALNTGENRPSLEHVVLSEGCYCVPRDGGRLVVGTTVEEGAGYDTSVTAGGIYKILAGLQRIFPGAEALPIIETWAGLRPKTMDDMPILGPTPIEGLSIASGHFDIGIILTPITAELMSEYLMTRNLSEEMKPFEINRFYN